MKNITTDPTLNTLANTFLDCITEHPGCRRRDLPKWGANRIMSIKALHVLFDKGLIHYEQFKDPANMEFYDKLYAN